MLYLECMYKAYFIYLLSCTMAVLVVSYNECGEPENVMISI